MASGEKWVEGGSNKFLAQRVASRDQKLKGHGFTDDKNVRAESQKSLGSRVCNPPGSVKSQRPQPIQIEPLCELGVNVRIVTSHGLVIFGIRRISTIVSTDASSTQESFRVNDNVNSESSRIQPR